MKKILSILYVIVAITGCGKTQGNIGPLSTKEQQNAVSSADKPGSIIGAYTNGTPDSNFESASALIDEPFTPIPPTSIEFLLDFTGSSTPKDECLNKSLPLRQKIPLFFFSLASQRKESDMNVALGVSYFTNGNSTSLIPVSNNFRRETTWYNKIVQEPRYAGNGDNYVKVIDEAIAEISKTNLDPTDGDLSEKQVLILIGDGTFYADQNPKDAILAKLTEHKKLLERERKSFEFYILLYCTSLHQGQKKMWDELDQNDYIKVIEIDADSFEWLKDLSKGVLGVSSEAKYWPDNKLRNRVLRVSGDDIVKIQGIGLSEGGQLIAQYEESEIIVETSRELPNWFFDKNRISDIRNDCGVREIKIRYTGSDLVFYWLENEKFEFSEPSLSVYPDKDAVIAVVKMKLPQGGSRLGVENCYNSFLKIDKKEFPLSIVSSSCKFDVCLENSSLVSTYRIDINDILSDMTNLEYGFTRKDGSAVVMRSTVIPAPYLISQNVEMKFLDDDDSERKLKSDGETVDTFSIQIPIIFYDKNSWSINIEANVIDGKDNSAINIDGLPNGASVEKCPGVNYQVNDESEKIQHGIIQNNNGQMRILEILMMTNVGWEISNGEVEYKDYCEFTRFEVNFQNKNGIDIMNWVCAQEDEDFSCELRNK